MARDLTNLYVSESFQHLLQKSGSFVQTGVGVDVTSLDISASYATYADVAGGATIATSASHAVNADSASYTPNAIVTGSVSNTILTFTKGDGSSFNLEVSVSASAESASYATFAETANTANSATSASLATENVFTASNDFSEITFTKGDGSTFLVDGTPRKVIETVKNKNGFMAKGTPVYVSGSTGNASNVYQADASDPAKMPAAYVLAQDLATDAEGEGIVVGFINGVNTSAFSAGDNIYVAAGGGYTNVKPTGSALIQKLGNVIAVDATNGSGVITGAGRSNDLPNIAQNFVWKGDANGVPQAVNQNTLSVATASYVAGANVDGQVSSAASADTATSASHALVSDTVNDANVAYVNQNNVFTGTQTFDNIAVNGTGSFAYIQSVTGSAKIIGDAFIILNNDLPSERYAGIKVQDSGSGAPLTTASLEFDGQTNDWFYEYSNDGGVTTDHGVVIFGPEYDTKGSPTYLTSNTIPKSSGSHHIVDSNITDDGAKVSINSDLDLNGTNNVALNNSLNFFENGSSTSALRFYSGSTTGANYINIQSVPGGNGQVAIAAFPANDHYLFLNDPTGTPDISFDVPLRAQSGVLRITGGSSLEDGTNVTGSLNVAGNTGLTGNLGVTGQTTLTGSLVVSGSTNFWKTNWPGSFQTNRIIDFGSITGAGSVVYDDNHESIFNYGGVGSHLNGVVRTFTGDSSNYFTSFWHGPNAAYFLMTPSGSAAESTISLRNDSGTVVDARVDGTNVIIGDTVAGSIKVGNSSAKTTVSGSMVGEVNSLSIASATASLDASTGNYFDLTLVSGSNTHVTVSNISAGQTYILKTEQPTTATDSHGTITFNSEFKFSGGTAPTATATSGSVDVYTFVSMDSSNVLSTQVTDLK